MTRTRPPGVFMERGQSRAPALGLLPSGVPAFMGLTERGPTNRPVAVRSMDEFYRIFGRLDVGTYLAAALDGFFLCGGREAYVVRIAHLFERGRRDIATRASTRLKDSQRHNTLLVQAMSEGMWGDGVRVSVVQRPPDVRTVLTLDARLGESTVMVKSTYGFARGSLVRLHDGQQSVYRVLTSVEGRSLTWAEKDALDVPLLSSAPTLVEPVGFDLIAQTHQQREVFRDLNLSRASPRFAERVINGTSQLIEVTSLDSPSPMPASFPQEIDQVALEGGTDGLFTVAPDDFLGADNGPGQRFGLAGLRELDDIDLLVLPDLPWCMERCAWSEKDVEVVQQAAVDLCEERRDCFAILDLPLQISPAGARHLSPTGALQWRRKFDTSYAAFYYPYVVVSESSRGGSSTSRAVPPSGHLAGVYARCDRDQGVYRAPANEALDGVVDLQLALSQADQATLNHEGINCLAVFPQRGIRVWGARTASSLGALRFVNVRRTVSAITRALHAGLQWVVFENNGPELWQLVDADVRYFLEALWRQGYLQGASAQEAFFVRCDEANNEPAVRDAGQLVVDVGIAPFRPAEFMGVRVVQELDALAREDGA